MTKKIYLDYAATTPLDPEVLKAMNPYFGYPPAGGFGNPSSLHFFGQEAMAAVDESREKIAASISADFREIIFTGSATEANNLALRGILKTIIQNSKIKNQNDNSKFKNNNSFNIYALDFKPRIIVSSIEHESILETCRDLEREGVEIIYLPVNRSGFVDLKKLKESLNERTIFVSIIYANNEIGTIQPLFEISQIINNFKKRKFEILNSKSETNSKFKILNSKQKTNQPINQSTIYPLFHTDAVQAFQFLDCDVNKLGVDLMTLSAHKIYGPKGIGALYIRNTKFKTLNSKQIKNSKLQIPNVSDLGFRISDLQQLVSPIVVGGGQEFGLRSGTENVPAIVGFAKAVELAVKNQEKEVKRIAELTNFFWKEIKKIEPKAELNGIMNYELGIRNKQKLPNILNVYFPNPHTKQSFGVGASQNAQDLLMTLDLAGIAVSSGSACSTRSTQPSHVLKVIRLSEKRIRNSLRFSFGKFTDKKEINNAIKIVKKNLI